jgi:nitrite reductase (NO-forming)
MKQQSRIIFLTGFALIGIISFLLAACSGAASSVVNDAAHAASNTSTVTYTLKTGILNGKMVFIGQGGDIDRVTNPDLKAAPGDVVQINLVDGDGAEHNLSLPDLGIDSDHVTGFGATTKVTFKVDQAGQYAYFCNIPGHRQAGMEGKLVVGAPQVAGETAAPVQAVSIVRDPTDLPASVGNRPAQKVRIDLEAVELEGQLADGVTYTYWTFGGKVPGPFLRVRVGDMVELHLKNKAGNTMYHSIDLHAVTGPGGGSSVTSVAPGEEKSFTFKARKPGLFVYHCATPMVADHIANGMYGLILVEPEGGLPPVDHEFYVMQGEVYTTGAFGDQGHQGNSIDKLLSEKPDYVVFNGAANALTTVHPMHANVDETVRIFFGDGGPNLVSSFHVIGEIFDRVYDLGSLSSQPMTDVQTTLVPPGGATLVEFTLQVPGRYILVDHAISRLQRGAAGYLLVDGNDNPDIFSSGRPPD